MTIKQKQCLLAYLGYYTGTIDGSYGPLSQRATEAFQRDYQLTVDGKFGPNTEKRILEVVASGEAPQQEEDAAGDSWWADIKHFTREEFRCHCGGKYCNGYPHEIQPLLMQILDRARRWSGHPIVIVSGLRCETWNKLQGGVDNSQHKFGEAADVYFYGKTPAAALAWLQSQPDVRFAYIIPGSNNIHFDIQPVGR